MVLPIDPNSIPINPTTGLAQVNNSFRKDVMTGVTNYAIPDLPPDVVFIPTLVPPKVTSMLTFSLVIDKAKDNAKDMNYYGRQVDELITKRFYGANAANVFSPFITSVTTVNTIYDAEVSNPNYLTYLQGLNTDVPAINSAIQTYTAGLSEEQLQIQTINDAITTFVSNPVTSATVATLNAAINTYNTYAALRQVDIQNYNNAVNTYNADITNVNSAINAFNVTFSGQGALVPLPTLPTATLRNSIPLNLPPADESSSLATDLGNALGISISGAISPYVAYTYINDQVNTQTINAPDFGGNVTVNAAIAALNTQNAAEQQAVNDLNTAILNFNDPSNANYGNSVVLQAAIDTYNNTVSTNGFDTNIANFNSEVVNNFNSTLGATINNGINVINSYIPPNLLQYSPITLSAVSSMPTAPSGTYIPGQVFPVAVPSLYPSVSLIQTPQIDRQTFAPFVDSSNQVLTDSSGNIMLELPSVDGIPPVVNPDASYFTGINSFFTTLNNDISTYNTTVGDSLSPSPGTENAVIQTLNTAISTYNAAPNQSNLDALIAANNAYAAAIVPINAAINSLNAEVTAFNNGTGPNTLGGLNSEINSINQSRTFYGLPTIPTYTALPLRALMPSALTLNANLSQNPQFITSLPTRSTFTAVPDMSEIEIDAVYVLGLASTVNFSLSDALYQTYEEVQSASFTTYVDKLKNTSSPTGYVDVNQYDQAISTYSSSATTPIPVGMSASDYPAVAVSGSNILVDSATQQAVTQDLLAKINSSPMTLTDTDITQYNNYAALVNATSVQSMNAAIDTFNAAIGVADPQNPVTVPNPDDPSTTITTDYPEGTLNFYASVYNQDFGGTGFYTSLTIVNAIPHVTDMPGGLPSLSAYNVTINGTPVNFYQAISQLNQDIGTQPVGGGITVNDLNSLINGYNTSGVIGSPTSTDVNTENGAINVLNTAISSTFTSNVSSTDYSSALTQLQSSIDAYNNTQIPPLNSTISTLNGQINDFNTNSLSGVNTYAQSSLNAINTAIENDLPQNSFSLLTSLSGLSNVASLPDYTVSTNSGVIPGTLTPVPGNIGTQSTFQFAMSLPDRTASAPSTIPLYFTTIGATSDLVNLKNTVYDPLITAIQNYNQELNTGNGVDFENSTISALNTAITAFNNGQITSADLKAAVNTYVQAVSTNATNANSNITALNTAIIAWQNAMSSANTSLTYWGFPPIENVFNVPTRSLMPSPPMPSPDSSSDYQVPVQALTPTTAQPFPSTSVTVTNPNTGEPITIQINYELNEVNYQLLGVTELVTINQLVSVLLTFAGIRRVASLLVNIERFVELQNQLRGPQGSLPNAYIEPTTTPNPTIGALGSVALATMTIGLTTQFFSELLNTVMFRELLTLFQLPYSSSILKDFQNSVLNLIFGASLLAAPPTMAALAGRIPPPLAKGLLSAGSTPIGPVFALHFIDQIRSLVGAGVVPTLIQGTFGGRVSGEKLDTLSTAFNLALLNVVLSVLSRVFGADVIPAILRQVPSIAAFGIAGRAPDFLSPLTFDEVLRGNMEAVKSRIVKGLQGLIQSGVVQMNPNSVGSVVQNGVINQLTELFYTPGQFADALNFLLNRATGQNEIRALRQLAFEAAAYVADQLPSETVNAGILGHSIDIGVIQQGGLRDALTSSIVGASSTSSQINTIVNGVMADLINRNAIQDSIIKANAIAFQLQQDAIRRELINSQTIAQAQLNQDNTLASVRDSVLANSDTQQAIDQFDLANATVQQLLQNDLVNRAAVNYDILHRELIQRGIVDEYATNEVVALQREYQRQQRIGGLYREADANAAMVQALQNTFNLSNVQAGEIAKSVISPPPNIPSVGNSNAANAMQWLLDQLIIDRLKDYDVKRQNVLFGELKKRIIEDHNSFLNLMEQQVKKVVALNNDKLNRIMTDRFRQLFKNESNLGYFVDHRLLSPAYSLIYSANAGPMYSKPEHNTNFVNSIDIHI